MPAPTRPSAEHLTWRHPIARWRHIARSPAYRLGTTDRPRRRAAAVICAAAVLGIWFGLPPLYPGSMAGQATPLVLVLIEWTFLTAAACVAGTTAFWPERRAGSMDQLMLAPLDSYELIRDRALAAATPLVPALAIAAVLSFFGLLPMERVIVVVPPPREAPGSLWWHVLVWLPAILNGLICLVIALSMLTSAYLGIAVGMWMTFALRWPFLALPLALIVTCLIETLASWCLWAFLPVVILMPFARIVLAGLVLAHCERLFNRQRLPGEDDADPPNLLSEYGGAGTGSDDANAEAGGQGAPGV